MTNPKPQILNRTLYIADNIRVLRGINTASVDLIATDPPFNSKRQFNAPLGSRAAKARFDDRWQWDEVTDELYDVIATASPAVREVIEAAAVIEGGRVDSTSTALREVDDELDHLIPKVRGGDDGASNRIGLCGDCNRRKSKKARGNFLADQRAGQAHPPIPGAK